MELKIICLMLFIFWSLFALCNLSPISLIPSKGQTTQNTEHDIQYFCTNGGRNYMDRNSTLSLEGSIRPQDMYCSVRNPLENGNQMQNHHEKIKWYHRLASSAFVELFTRIHPGRFEDISIFGEVSDEAFEEIQMYTYMLGETSKGMLTYLTNKEKMWNYDFAFDSFIMKTEILFETENLVIYDKIKWHLLLGEKQITTMVYIDASLYMVLKAAKLSINQHQFKLNGRFLENMDIQFNTSRSNIRTFQQQNPEGKHQVLNRIMDEL